MSCECLVALLNKCSGIIIAGVGCVLSFFPSSKFGTALTTVTTILPMVDRTLTSDHENSIPGALKAGLGKQRLNDYKQPLKKAIKVISFTSCLDLWNNLLE